MSGISIPSLSKISDFKPTLNVYFTIYRNKEDTVKKLILETSENEHGSSGELQVISRKNGEGKGVDGAEHKI